MITSDDQSQETCPDDVAAFERPRKGVQAAVGIFLSGKGPVAKPVAFAQENGGGILYFQIHDDLSRERLSLRNLCVLCVSAVSFLEQEFTAESQRTPRTRRGIARWSTIALCAIACVTASCANRQVNTSTSETTREVTDEAGRRVKLPLHIDRIVSLAPNLTEIVYAVGAGDRLVGDTEYCDYPTEAKGVAKIGDTMHPSVERIIALKPQIVLVSTASQLEAFTKQLDQQQIAVYVTNPQSLDDVFRSIQTLGGLLGHHDWAATMVAELRQRAAAVGVAMRTVKPVKVFYQLSGEPLYTIGRESYLTDLVRRAGGVSATGDVPGAFPRFSDEAALAARPEAIILPTGGSMGTANSTVAAPLKNSPAALNGRIYKINDDHLSRPGPRLVDGLEEMARALHPEAFK